MDWNGTNKQYLRQALLSIYSSPVKLARFVSDEFNRNLNEISTESSLEDRAFELLEEAASGGWINELYSRFCECNQKHERVAQLLEELQDTSSGLTISGVLQNPTSPERLIEEHENGSNSEVIREGSVADLIEPVTSAHLVVVVFWKGEKGLKQYRVSPKLCYREQETSPIKHEPLMNQEDIDKAPISQDKFPDFLKGLHTFALRKLNSYADRPWKLSVDLLLPLDCLCLPLTTWCGRDGDLISKHSIVIGCSDRFDPSCPENSNKLLSQLKVQWEVFFSKVPDEVGSTLKKLDWLDSDKVGKKGWTAHAGFRCFGDWLVPGDWAKLDESSRKKWKDLIEYGLPLALWMCQGNPPRSKRRKIFNSLIQGTRFDLLDKVPIERDVQRHSGNCVGVLYEDLNYMPELPKVEEQQFFSWPGV
jgi:hypothetical protein